MKIQIHDQQENVTEGFNSVTYQNLNAINEIIDNSCEYILAGDIFDNFPQQEFELILNVLIAKLRLGGSLTITGTDIKLMSKFVCDESINIQEVSQVISNKKSLRTLLDIVENCENKNLKIVNTKFNGYNYEILCTR